MSIPPELEECSTVQPVVSDNRRETEGVQVTQVAAPADSRDVQSAARKPWRFYAIIVALGFTGLLTALEATITSVALPTIIDKLGGGNLFIWVVNVYFLALTAFQPLYGQLANIFGRRYPTIIATAGFLLGSGVCGGANSVGMLIAGRVIQGAGAGGVNVLVEIIICDLVPLQERGNYIALIFGFITVGTALGPVFGGLIVNKASWRWIFYLNLPIGGTALVLLLLFLQVKYETETTILAKLKRIDWTGNVIFASSVVAILMPLSWAGTQYAWSSFRIIVPLVLGLLGCVAFLFYEGSQFCLEPTMPIHLFTNRTSAASFILTFVHSIVTVWTIYFLQMYFQGVLASTPGRAGIQMLPTIMFLIPFTAIAGRIMSKWGLYRPIHHVGFALMAIGFGLFSLFDANTSMAEWVIYQGLEAAGAGLVIPALLPAVQAELTEADIALSTSTWAFVRSFGMIWGASIPAVIFSNTFDRLSGRITDPAVADTLTGAKAYKHATKIFLDSLQDPTVRAQVVGVFSHSLKTTWYVAIAFAGLGFIIVIAEREVPLREELETEFGMADK